MRKPNKLLIAIGNKCKMFREDEGMTLNEVAELVGTSRQNICYFEQGQNDSYIIFMAYLMLGMTFTTEELAYYGRKA